MNKNVTEVNDFAKLKSENMELKRKLHLLQEEWEQYFLKNRLKKLNIRYKKVPLEDRYGAVDYVKNSLQYKLGSVLIKESKSLLGWPKIPLVLLKEYNNYISPISKKIEEYYDYDEDV
ncbi:MAG: hypothetical protein Q4P13_10830, partial [Psychrobacter sp.]|nr:hypothetical protein [Psychrobacter sp.]